MHIFEKCNKKKRIIKRLKDERQLERQRQKALKVVGDFLLPRQCELSTILPLNTRASGIIDDDDDEYGIVHVLKSTDTDTYDDKND